MQENNIAQLVPNKPDREVAEELKRELAEAAKPYLEACTKAHKLGFQVASQFGPNMFGDIVINQLALYKYY